MYIIFFWSLRIWEASAPKVPMSTVIGSISSAMLCMLLFLLHLYIKCLEKSQCLKTSYGGIWRLEAYRALPHCQTWMNGNSTQIMHACGMELHGKNFEKGTPQTLRDLGALSDQGSKQHLESNNLAINLMHLPIFSLTWLHLWRSLQPNCQI